MKRLTAGLLALMLLATLLPGCGKKEQWNVDNFFLSDDGTTYSVSYRHDVGTEEVVAEMGSYPQPLTIIAGKLYYVHGGSMVAVDLKDPTQRQTLTEPGLSGLSIGFIDDGAVYCPLATDTEKCYRVALDLSECTRPSPGSSGPRTMTPCWTRSMPPWGPSTTAWPCGPSGPGTPRPAA